MHSDHRDVAGISGAKRAGVGAASLAAAMLMTGPVLAKEAADASNAAGEAVATAEAEAERNAIVVIGRGQEVDLATMRGPVLDVPQAINIIDERILKDRQVTTLADALRNVAGVTTSVGEGGVVNGDQFFIRGQPARDDIFTDGLRDFGAFTRDSFNYDSVQVLKGSSSTALGRGVSGGAINTQSKRAMVDDVLVANVSGGSDKYGRITLDANKALGDTTGLRLNLMAHHNNTPDRDTVFSRRWGAAPALGFNIGGQTSFDLIYFHQEETKRVDYGVPIAQTTAVDIERPVTELGVPRSTFYGFAGDLDKTVVNTLTGRFAHTFAEGLTLTSDSKLGVYKRAFRQTVPSCAATTCGDLLIDNNIATVPMVSSGVRGQFRQTTRGAQNVTTLIVAKPVGDLRNELIVGWDVSYQTNDREDDIRPNNGAVSSVSQPLLAPTGSAALTFPHQVFQYRDSKATDLSFFVDERLWLTPTLSLNLGVRYQHFETEQDTVALTTNANGPITSCNGVTGVFTTCFSKLETTDNLWSPKAALIWEPSEKASFYLSYSKASVPAGNSLSNGSLSAPGTGGTIATSDLKPETTETFDLGAKFSLFRDRLLVQSAIYQIDRSNTREVDPATQLFVASAEPKQRLRGFEIGASGTVTRDILLTVNYAYVDAEIREAFASGARDVAAIGKQVRYIPKHALSFWGSYKPTEGSLKGAEIGVGANYQSKVYVNNTNTQVAPSYLTFDALVGYSFDRYRVAVNAYNLTDKRYYGQVNGGRVVPAAGRSVVASFGVMF